MIRINLLPVKAARKRERAERALLGMAVAVVVVAIALFVLHRIQANEIADVQAQNAEYAQKIEKLKQEVGNFDELKAKRETLVAQREVINKLEVGRVGPVKVLLEMARLLSPGGQPTMDPAWYEQILREQPQKAYDPTWDARRLVVLTFLGREDGKTQIEGLAKDNSDVAEFVRRLELSRYFDDPYIERSDTVTVSEAVTGVKHVRFALHVKVIH